jgi:hypothetical protein
MSPHKVPRTNDTQSQTKDTYSLLLLRSPQRPERAPKLISGTNKLSDRA